MSQVFNRFLQGLDESKCLDDCFNTLTTAVETLGYDGILYSANPQFPAVNSSNPIMLFSSGWNIDFIKHYRAAGWYKDNLAFERALQGSLRPINWAYELQTGQLSSIQNSIINTALDGYGMKNAISIPTASTNKLIAGATVISRKKESSFTLLNKEKYGELNILIQTFHDHVFTRQVYRKSFYLPTIEQFSETELKLIRFVVSGQKLKMCQELCGVSPTRAGNILSSMYKRLKIRNSTEFGHLIGSHDLLDYYQ